MTAIVLDSGALIALDRNDRATWALLRVAADDGLAVHVPAGAIGQAWRDRRRQPLLSRALAHCDEVPLDGLLARAAGKFCGQAATADVVGPSVAITAAGLARREEITVVTSDEDDLRFLLSVVRGRVRIVPV